MVPRAWGGGARLRAAEAVAWRSPSRRRCRVVTPRGRVQPLPPRLPLRIPPLRPPLRVPPLVFPLRSPLRVPPLLVPLRSPLPLGPRPLQEAPRGRAHGLISPLRARPLLCRRRPPRVRIWTWGGWIFLFCPLWRGALTRNIIIQVLFPYCGKNNKTTYQINIKQK